MGTFQTTTCVEAEPERFLNFLVDPQACGRWSPVPLDVRPLDGKPLAPGSQARLSSRLAGREVGFDIRVLEADDCRLAIRASGPFDVDASCEAVARGERTEVRASVSVQGSGLRGRVLGSAAEALLAAGLLDSALARLAAAATPH
jgi:hypothetical protein